MTQAIGPITMVSVFNGFIDLICFKNLHPKVNDLFEQNKCCSTFILNYSDSVRGGRLKQHVKSM